MIRWSALLALAFVFAGCGGDTVTASDASTTPHPDASGGLDATQAPGPDASRPDAGQPDSSTGPDPQKACADTAAAVCAKISSCSAFGLGAVYGDLSTCKTRYAISCMATFSGTGTHHTPATTETCANSIGALDCASFLALNYGAACAPIPGDLANAAACGDDSQCSSTFCARPTGSQCGTCAATTSAGSPCVNGACSTGTTCPTGAANCIAPVAGKVNDVCTYQAQCDLAQGVGCNTTSSKCMALMLSTDGTCGLNGASPFKVCPGTGTCSNVLGGNCASAAVDGTACDATNGPSCLPPARCVGSICTLPDPTKCH